jgi:hypothetical protein
MNFNANIIEKLNFITMHKKYYKIDY